MQSILIKYCFMQTRLVTWYRRLALRAAIGLHFLVLGTQRSLALRVGPHGFIACGASGACVAFYTFVF